MVYLIRHVRVERDWEKMEDASKAMMDYWRKQPTVKGVEMWGNIAGPQDEFRIVAKFDTLADEEKFALGLWDDKGYGEVFMKFAAVFRLEEDELVRSF
ncbi:MAG TPA: hypothetical protein VFL04_02245 [Rectinemataceae bacterium]|nr:hypothetical protein [Rectinemataceae bacterium]